MKDDMISRQGLKESLLSEDYEKHEYCFPCKKIMKRIDEQPSAQPELIEKAAYIRGFEQGRTQEMIDAKAEQHGRVFKGIVVKYPPCNTYTEYIGKPYFSIKYTENGQEFVSYGTYNPEVLSEYLKEYFMPSAQPETKE